MHPSLGLVHQAMGNQSCWHWSIVEHWAENDPRRESIKKGEVSPDFDFDVIGDAPQGMTAGDAYEYLIRALRSRPQTKADYGEMLERVTNYNAEQAAENMKDVTDFANEMVEANAKTLWRKEGKSVPKVYQNEAKAKRSRKGK
ncbi:MAG: hypothetical protein ABIS03_10215 [Gemmatimonadaceae bacterium]